jgi:hypothetical protein
LKTLSRNLVELVGIELFIRFSYDGAGHIRDCEVTECPPIFWKLETPRADRRDF